MATRPAAGGCPRPRTPFWPLVLPVGVFLALLMAVWVGVVVPSADEAVRAWVHAHRWSTIARLSLPLTEIGNPSASVIALLLVAVVMARRRGNVGPLLASNFHVRSGDTCRRSTEVPALLGNLWFAKTTEDQAGEALRW